MQVKTLIFVFIFFILLIVFFALPQVQYFFDGAFKSLVTLNTVVFADMPEIIKWSLLGAMIAFSIGIIYKLYGTHGKS